MEQFTKLHADQVNGVLSGFDRVRLRGTLTPFFLGQFLRNCQFRVSEKLGYAPCTGMLAHATDAPPRSMGKSARASTSFSQPSRKSLLLEGTFYLNPAQWQVPLGKRDLPPRPPGEVD